MIYWWCCGNNSLMLLNSSHQYIIGPHHHQEFLLKFMGLYKHVFIQLYINTSSIWWPQLNMRGIDLQTLSKKYLALVQNWRACLLFIKKANFTLTTCWLLLLAPFFFSTLAHTGFALVEWSPKVFAPEQCGLEITHDLSDALVTVVQLIKSNDTVFPK